MDSTNELMHFNPNHDPKSGQFTSNKGGSSSFVSESKYYKKNGKLTYRGKRRVRKTMSTYNDMVTASTGAQRRSAEKKFSKMTNKMTQPEIEELIQKVSAEKTIRDMTPQDIKKSKYDLTPKEAVDLTNSVMQAANSMMTMMYNYKNNKIAINTNQSKYDQEIEKAKQQVEKTKQSELKTLIDQQNAFEKSRAYNTTLKNLKNENSDLQSQVKSMSSQNDNYKSQVNTLKTQNDNLNSFVNSVKNQQSKPVSNNSSTSLLLKYNESYLNKKQAQNISNMMQSDFKKAVTPSTVDAGKSQVSSIKLYTMDDLSRETGKWW